MARETIDQLSTEKLKKRKKAGLILVWILFGIACFDLGVVGYKMGDDSFETSLIVPLVLIPVMMGIILLSGIIKINKELKSRD